MEKNHIKILELLHRNLNKIYNKNFKIFKIYSIHLRNKLMLLTEKIFLIMDLLLFKEIKIPQIVLECSLKLMIYNHKLFIKIIN